MKKKGERLQKQCESINSTWHKQNSISAISTGQLAPGELRPAQARVVGDGSGFGSAGGGSKHSCQVAHGGRCLARLIFIFFYFFIFFVHDRGRGAVGRSAGICESDGGDHGRPPAGAEGGGKGRGTGGRASHSLASRAQAARPLACRAEKPQLALSEYNVDASKPTVVIDGANVAMSAGGGRLSSTSVSRHQGGRVGCLWCSCAWLSMRMTSCAWWQRCGVGRSVLAPARARCAVLLAEVSGGATAWLEVC